MDIKRILVVLAATALLPGTLWVQAATLKADHPQRYTVKKGDTLWDISGRFLEQPWYWPRVWEANPQIENPHLIYPGDEIVLVYTQGKPRLRVNRRGGGRPTIKLSPRTRAERIDTAIPTIPIDEIHQFLERPKVVTDEEIDGAPYIVSAGRKSLIAAPGEMIFARGIRTGSPDRFTVYRRGQAYKTESGEVIGLEAVHVGDAQVVAEGDPSTLVLTSVNREVLVGDRLFPVTDEEVDTHFKPRVPEGDPKGQIVAVFEGVTQIGQHQIVVLDLGEQDGIAPGHVLSVYQRGETIVDTVAKPPEVETVAGRKHLELDPEYQGGVRGALVAADDYVVNLTNTFKSLGKGFGGRVENWRKVKLPDEKAGTVMVFRSFEKLSYALVMEARRAMNVYDALRPPR